ncbi:MAG: PAS domain S-box protein, partial [Bacteriovoracaceae bacterium]|nr:PAS domain S-box protein [Bacteriovoracaceae bacterium]
MKKVEKEVAEQKALELILNEQTKTLEKFRRMATVIKDSNDAITFQDLEGNILAWNRGAEQIYGYSEVEALRMNIIDTVPAEYQEEAQVFLASLKRGELVPNFETKRKHKNGRIIDVWLTNTKLTDDEGRLTGIATTERDITQRKQAEVSFREKTRELEFLREGQITLSDRLRGEQDVSSLGQSVLSHLVPFLGAQMGAFYYVPTPHILKRVSGYAYAKLETQEKNIAFGEGLVGQVALEKKLIFIENIPSHYFERITSDVGSAIPRSLLLAPVTYEGKVNGVIELASFTNFSEHQKTFLQNVTENIGIAINTSISRKKQQELLERSQDLSEELQNQQDELKAINDELAEQSQALQKSEIALKNQQLQLEQSNQQLEQQRDILDQNNQTLSKAQMLLQERSDEVQRASQYKSEFLANMSHELRTPLNSSLILSKLLADNVSGNLTAEQIQYASSIFSAGNDLLDLINDILDLSKVEAGKLEIRSESVFLAKVFSNLQKTFDPVAQEKNLAFQINIHASVPETIYTDRQRMEQILKNLLSNAFKFTEKGKVKLNVSCLSPHKLSFSVIDTGIGIPVEQQDVIFEAFRQTDGRVNRKYAGTGLGLSISRDLAKLLGGGIEVESVIGEGSRFTLFLPETCLEISLVTEERKENVKLNFFLDDRDIMTASERKLLVIEDEIQFAQILYNLAHELNYKCIVAQNAKEGLELAQKFLPSAIFLDMILPDYSGLTVLDQLKEDSSTRHIP